MNCENCGAKAKVTLVPRKNCTRLDIICPSCGYQDYDYRDIKPMTAPDWNMSGDMHDATVRTTRNIKPVLDKWNEANRERLRRRSERLKGQR